jgi:glycosyltransferase involved in cell wall biosynthesis
MTDDQALDIALLYDEGGYVETTQGANRALPSAPQGLMGRQVAGKEFLDAYLQHGRWNTLHALARSRGHAEPLVRLCRDHPSSRTRQRRLRIIEQENLSTEFLADPPARLIYFPHPPEERFAWARHHLAPGQFALCGVTHTLASLPVVHHLGAMLTAPYESYDTLICTSRAVANMVRAVTAAYGDYLQDRIGGQPRLRIRLEVIPLGVDTERFHPPGPEERNLERRNLGVQPDEVAVLFVGRLAMHAKAHPFPLYRACREAARRTGQKVHLILAGWAPNQAMLQAYEGGARVFAPGVRVSIVDGTRPAIRSGMWRAADIFASLPDNLQETFGLVIVEAMASGLPVLGSDWDGYRDLVTPGQTGFLADTFMIPGATTSSTSRLVLGEIDYDHYLAETSQAIVVDPQSAADAMTRLVADPALSKQMGAAGRRRAEECFAWQRVIHAYESLWRQQETERLASIGGPAAEIGKGQPSYAAPEQSFAGYPTRWLGETERLIAEEGASALVATLLNMPLTSHAAKRRILDAAVLRQVIHAALPGATLGKLAHLLDPSGAAPEKARATLAWLLKYHLLRRAATEEVEK